MGNRPRRSCPPPPALKPPDCTSTVCSRREGQHWASNAYGDDIGPAMPPGADRMTLAPESRGDVLVGSAAEGREDYPCPLRDGLGAGARAGHGQEDGLLAFGDEELACLP